MKHKALGLLSTTSPHSSAPLHEPFKPFRATHGLHTVVSSHLEKYYGEGRGDNAGKYVFAHAFILRADVPVCL